MTEYYLIDGIQPEPWEAPEGSVGRAPGGKLFCRLTTKRKQRAYQEHLADAFREQYPDVEMAECPIALCFYFWRDRPLAETEKRKVRSAAADATNLQKATEDALQKILYKNDRQVVIVESVIMQQEQGTEPAILIVMIRNPIFGRDYIECTVEALRATRTTIDRTANDNIRDDHKTIPF